MTKPTIPKPPRGLAMLLLVGPAFVWCAEYIGSGEVILSTRMGAVLGYAVLWAPFVGILLKTFIGAGGAHYTVCTGEGMMDMMSRLPGRGNWMVWIVFIGQTAAGAISIAGVASAAGVFAHSLVPLNPFVWSWILALFAVIVVWSGKFELMKYIMSVFVLVIVLGVLFVAVRTAPDIAAIIHGVFGFTVPDVPVWARTIPDVSPSPWEEILPLIGWAAGGFASQVWYTYWVIGAGYGMAHNTTWGSPCDTEKLKTLDEDDGALLRGWRNVVYTDATVAMTIGIVVTCGFLLAGAGVLRIEKIAPEGPAVALQLSQVFGIYWGTFGSVLFRLAGTVALISTLIGQLGGWPRLIADSVRICIPRLAEGMEWKRLFRILLVLFFIVNMIVVFSAGIKPVFLIKMSAVFEGLLLTPFQALAVLAGLVWILPKLLPDAVWRQVKPGPIIITGLITAALVFGYFCIVMLPKIM